MTALLRPMRWVGMTLLALALAFGAACADRDNVGPDEGSGIPGLDPVQTTEPFPTSTATAPPFREGGGGGTIGEAQETVDVSLDEWSVDVGRAEVPSGQITFQVRNAGSMPHSLVVVRVDEGTAAGELPMMPQGAVVDLTEVVPVGTITRFPADETRETTIAMEPGKYVLFCNLAGHYENGMHAGLEVSE